MLCARILICIAAIVAPVHGAACDPEDEVCHGCNQVCSHYTDDTTLVTDAQCVPKCQAEVYNCREGTLPAEVADGEREKCIEEALLKTVREEGDLITKICYDVPPTFEELDQLFQEDGRIDSRDMAVAADILDGGAAPDGTTIPTTKVSAIMETFREADVDGDGVVTEGEFNAYAKGDDHMGHHVEEMHPTPDQKPVEEAPQNEIVEPIEEAVTGKGKGKGKGKAKGKGAPAPAPAAEEAAEEAAAPAAAEEFLQDEVEFTQSAFRSPKANKNRKKFHRKDLKKVHEKKAKQTGLAYFQHMLRLAFRVERAVEKKQHPIQILALKMYKSKNSQQQQKSTKKH